MDNFITWYDILTVFIWTIIIYTIIAVILLAISHFTEKLRNKKKRFQRSKEWFKIVECSNKDDYKFKTPRPEPPPPMPPKKSNSFSDLKTCLCYETGIVEEDCQNRMSNGKCTSFVCTKIVRFK